MVLRSALWCVLAALCIHAAVASASAQDLAPSCATVANRFQVDDGLLKSGNLLAVVGDTLVDADEATFPPRGARYDFYYLFRNDSCPDMPCMSTPIILIKTIKVTNYSAPISVFLMREGSEKKTEVSKPDYDDFHERERTPFPPYNAFHLTYSSPGGSTLHTHYPRERRQHYLFNDLPTATPEPWLTARNYAFTLNPDNQLQCIPLNMIVQKRTTLASIEVVVVESGLGDNPTDDTIRKWDIVPPQSP